MAKNASFALSTVVSMNPAMNDRRRVQFAYAGIIPANGGRNGDSHGLATLLIGLALLGTGLLGNSERRRLTITGFGALMILLALGAAGCGGSSGGAPAARPSSTQTITHATVTLGGTVQTVGGLPAILGTIKG